MPDFKTETKRERTQIMTLAEVSKYIGMHKMSVYRYIKKGTIPGFKVGGQWRVSKAALDAHFEATTVKPPK
jgi:excisionase family DNA binding protein